MPSANQDAVVVAYTVVVVGPKHCIQMREPGLEIGKAPLPPLLRTGSQIFQSTVSINCAKPKSPVEYHLMVGRRAEYVKVQRKRGA